jgi:hypothetical protein
LLTIQELSDDFLKLLVKHRIRILDRLQEFIKDDIGFGRKGGRKGFTSFSPPAACLARAAAASFVAARLCPILDPLPSSAVSCQR